ncbi:MAG: hypothetical protein PHP17_05375 [Candidatus Omnitrophica bacterium]|nr:hypothetical protein [Candidatus Omnitrophota bacterium]
MLTKLRQAQSTLEYALLISVVVGGLLTMQNYLKRSVQGRLRASADEIGEQYSPGQTYRQENMFSQLTGNMTESTTKGFDTQTVVNIGGMSQSQNVTQNIKSLESEKWPTKPSGTVGGGV